MTTTIVMANSAILSILFPDSRQRTTIPVFPFFSSSSLFFAGGTPIYGAIRSSSPFLRFSVSLSSPSSHFNKKISARRIGRLVVAAADYYSTLGVSKSTSNKEIKAAYRRLARQVLSRARVLFLRYWIFFVGSNELNLAFGGMLICLKRDFLPQQPVFTMHLVMVHGGKF